MFAGALEKSKRLPWLLKSPIPPGADNLQVHVGMVFDCSGPSQNLQSDEVGDSPRWNSTSRWREEGLAAGFSTAIFNGAKEASNDRIMADISHRKTGSFATGLGLPSKGPSLPLRKARQPGKIVAL